MSLKLYISSYSNSTKYVAPHYGQYMSLNTNRKPKKSLIHNDKMYVCYGVMDAWRVRSVCCHRIAAKRDGKKSTPVVHKSSGQLRFDPVFFLVNDCPDMHIQGNFSEVNFFRKICINFINRQK